jgi:nitrogen PTS system EIIA component
MHLGATIRLLRIDAGLSLRDLAQRIGVSSAYLSRVEHGHDAVPTHDRLQAIARELGVPAHLLVDAGNKVGPALEKYVEAVPSAGMLFLDIAQRQLGPAEIARVRGFVEREFIAGARSSERPSLARLLCPDRVILQLTCPALEDALTLAASRLARTREGPSAWTVAEELLRRESAASTVVGSGVMVPHAFFPGVSPSATLVTLARPLSVGDAQGSEPVRLLVVFVHSGPERSHLALLAHVACLSSHGLAERLATAKTPEETLARVAELENIG